MVKGTSALTHDPGYSLTFSLTIKDEYAKFENAKAATDLLVGSAFGFTLDVTHADTINITINETKIEDLAWLTYDSTTKKLLVT